MKNTSFRKKRIRRIGRIEKRAAQQPIPLMRRSPIFSSENSILIFSLILKSWLGD